MKRTCVSLLVVATLVLPVMAKDKAAGAKAKTISGWITDEKCSRKSGDHSNAECARKCAEAGEKLVVVADKGQTVYNVDNQDALKGHEGQHVKVTGQDNNGTLHVDKVDRLSQSN